MKKRTSKRVSAFGLLVIFLLALIVLLLCRAGAQAVRTVRRQNRMTAPAVILDPGHGGVDGGAVGVGGVVEKNINLAIALKLRALFQAAGYSVTMTREDDRSIYDPGSDTIRRKKVTDLHNRLAMMSQNPQAIFISVHQNKFTDSQYSGTQIFYSPNNDGSRLLADTLQNQIQSLLQPQNGRKSKKASKDLFLLYYAKVPCVMVECGFLSNPREAALLQQDGYQGKMAFSVFAGTLRYYASRAAGTSSGSSSGTPRVSSEISSGASCASPSRGGR